MVFNYISGDSLFVLAESIDKETMTHMSLCHVISFTTCGETLEKDLQFNGTDHIF